MASALQLANIIYNKNIVTAGDVGNSDTGPNPVTTGTMVSRTVSWNGAYTNNLANYVTYDGSTVTPNKFMVIINFECDWSFNGAVPSDAGNHCFLSFDKEAGAPHNMFFFYCHGTLGWLFEIWVAGASTIFQISGIPAFNANEPHVLQLAYDQAKSLVGGTKTLEVDFDGGSKYTSAVQPGAMGAVPAGALFRTHVYGYDGVRIYTPDAAIDDLKVFNDTSDSLIAEGRINGATEGFATDTPTNVVATDGTYTTHVEISWDDMSVDTYTVYRSTTLGGVYSAIATGITVFAYNDVAPVAGTVYYYKVSATLSGRESDLSTADDGYRAIKVVSISCVKTAPQVLILDDSIDIYDLGHVNTIIKIKEKKTFKKDKLIINNITQIVKNFDNFYSVDNSVSIFNGIDWRYQPYKVYDQDGELIWDGIIWDIQRDHGKKLAKIKSVDVLRKYQKEKISYESSDWETPADAAKNIMDAISFTYYDNGTITASADQYTDNSCLIKVNFNKSADVTLQSALDKLGAIGCADVYNHKNNVYFQHWQPFTGGIAVNLTVSDIRSSVNVTSPDNEIINEYSIGYSNDADTPATDANSNVIGSLSQTRFGTRELEDIAGNEGNDIIFKDKTSATYIGECYIKRTNKNYDTQPRPLTKITFQLPVTHKDWVDLNTYFTLTLTDESWTTKKFEIFETDIDYTKNNITITAYEVVE